MDFSSGATKIPQGWSVQSPVISVFSSFATIMQLGGPSKEKNATKILRRFKLNHKSITTILKLIIGFTLRPILGKKVKKKGYFPQVQMSNFDNF